MSTSKSKSTKKMMFNMIFRNLKINFRIKVCLTSLTVKEEPYCTTIFYEQLNAMKQ